MANRAMKPEGIFRFGEFQIDALARTLRREKELVTLNRRAFDVLLYLAQNPGRVVSRDELLKNACRILSSTKTAWRKASPRCGGRWRRSQATTTMSLPYRGEDISLLRRCRFLARGA